MRVFLICLFVWLSLAQGCFAGGDIPGEEQFWADRYVLIIKSTKDFLKAHHFAIKASRPFLDISPIESIMLSITVGVRSFNAATPSTIFFVERFFRVFPMMNGISELSSWRFMPSSRS